jgi:hypothetical protein
MIKYFCKKGLWLQGYEWNADDIASLYQKDKKWLSTTRFSAPDKSLWNLAESCGLTVRFVMMEEIEFYRLDP